MPIVATAQRDDPRLPLSAGGGRRFGGGQGRGGHQAVRYFIKALRVDVTSPDGAAGVVAVYSDPANSRSIGEAYYCGRNAMGESVWSLKVKGQWLAGRWLLIGSQLVSI